MPGIVLLAIRYLLSRAIALLSDNLLRRLVLILLSRRARLLAMEEVAVALVTSRPKKTASSSRTVQVLHFALLFKPAIARRVTMDVVYEIPLWRINATGA